MVWCGVNEEARPCEDNDIVYHLEPETDCRDEEIRRLPYVYTGNLDERVQKGFMSRFSQFKE